MAVICMFVSFAKSLANDVNVLPLLCQLYCEAGNIGIFGNEFFFCASGLGREKRIFCDESIDISVVRTKCVFRDRRRMKYCYF